MYGEAMETGGGLLALAVAAGGGIGWFLNWLASRRKEQRAERLEDEKRDADRFDELYDRVNLDRAQAIKREEQCQAALSFLRSQVHEVQIRVRQMAERIGYLQEKLDEHKIPHRKWIDRDLNGEPGSPESPDPEPQI